MENIAELIEQMNQTILGDNQVFVDKREKIMTREEAHEFLKNKKVYVGRHSEAIQKKLFDAMYEWIVGMRAQCLSYPYLYMSDDGTIKTGTDLDYFNNKSDKKEITAEEILAIEIEEEPQFKPFEKILYRDSTEKFWRVGFYSNYMYNAHYISGAGFCKDVIPYEGNEDKLGKVTD